jgi:predicted nucleic acid-binding protein
MDVDPVLDTNIILQFFAGRLATGLPRQQYAASVITEMELLSYRLLTDAEEQRIRAFLSDIRLIDLTSDVREAAIRLRRQHRLTLPDAIIAGTALSLGSELWTNDRRLTSIPSLPSRLVELKPNG